MKTLYLECNMGASGDMLLSALLELINDKEEFLKKLNSLGISGVRYEAQRTEKCGITGTHTEVFINGETEGSHKHSHEHEHNHKHEHSHEHEHNSESTHVDKTHTHNSFNDIKEIIGKLNISQKAKDNALSIYNIVAEAEAIVHGKPVEQIHFHELGNMDAVADIVGVCVLMDELSPDKTVVSPVNTGSGFVRCAHGVLPVPAPATAQILKGVPVYSGNIKAELTTPTGAAILKHFAFEFGKIPVMTVDKIGYGMGSKDFETANCLRAFLGETLADEATNDEIAELSCNLDDMTGEAVGFASEILLENGALEVYTLPVQMKKSRPGIILVCLCKVNEVDRFAQLILKHTTTFGVRKSIMSRYTLDRSFSKRETCYGTVRIKEGSGYGVTKSKPEYEDAAEAAKKNNLSIFTILKEVEK